MKRKGDKNSQEEKEKKEKLGAQSMLRRDIEIHVKENAKEFGVSDEVLLKLANYCAQQPWFIWIHYYKDFASVKEGLRKVIGKEPTQKEIDALALTCLDVDLVDAAITLSEESEEKILEIIRDTLAGRGDWRGGTVDIHLERRQKELKNKQ